MLIKVCLEPIFYSSEISSNLIFIKCSLGYNGEINQLFADKKYDNIREITMKMINPLGKNILGTKKSF